MPKVPGQMGPYFLLTDDADITAASLDAILESPGASNLIEELHRRMHRKKVSDPVSLFVPVCSALFGPIGVIKGLAEAVKSGIADNYTYHFALTALVYALEISKRNPGFFEACRGTRAGPDGEEALKEYLRNIWENQKT